MSKITDGFENRHTNDELMGGYMSDDVEKLLVHARALEAMLRKHEWTNYDDTDYCVECSGLKHYGNPRGHSPDCELKRLIE